METQAHTRASPLATAARECCHIRTTLQVGAPAGLAAGLVYAAWRMVVAAIAQDQPLLQARTRHREVPDEGDCGDGRGSRNGRDDAGGAARAGTGDKRRARTGVASSPASLAPASSRSRRSAVGLADNEFALATDIWFASRERAVFAQHDIGFGVLPGGGGLEWLPPSSSLHPAAYRGARSRRLNHELPQEARRPERQSTPGRLRTARS
jgi:hypothetical protein